MAGLSIIRADRIDRYRNDTQPAWRGQPPDLPQGSGPTSLCRSRVESGDGQFLGGHRSGHVAQPQVVIGASRRRRPITSCMSRSARSATTPFACSTTMRVLSAIDSCWLSHALKERGWSISAIARHLERDRKTVRSYLNGDRQPGVRVTVVVDALAEFQGYVRARFVDDPHLWATSLFDEVVALGYTRSYPTFVRQVCQRGLRPHCEACAG